MASQWLTYRCNFCKLSYQRSERIDHKCPTCKSVLVRSTHADKRLEKAKRDLAELDFLTNQE